MKKLYIVYDGRARENTDNASVLSTCESLEEARKSLALFKEGKIKWDPIIFSYETGGEFLENETLVE